MPGVCPGGCLSFDLTGTFPCSRVFCSMLSFHFWLHKGRFRPSLGSNNYHASQGQEAILNLSKYSWTYSRLCTSPHVHRHNGINIEANLSERGRYGENIFNSSLMHKLIV